MRTSIASFWLEVAMFSRLSEFPLSIKSFLFPFLLEKLGCAQNLDHARHWVVLPETEIQAFCAFMMLWLLWHVLLHKHRAAAWSYNSMYSHKCPVSSHKFISVLFFGLCPGEEGKNIHYKCRSCPASGVRGTAHRGMVIILPSLSLHFL